MADELNRFVNGRLKYTVTMPEEEFFLNRPKITQMMSLYMNKYGIIKDDTFTEKIAREFWEVEL